MSREAQCVNLKLQRERQKKTNLVEDTGSLSNILSANKLPRPGDPIVNDSAFLLSRRDVTLQQDHHILTWD